MDNVNDPDLIIDSNGICNHCHNFDNAVAKLYTKEKAEVEFKKLTDKIKEEGKEKKYDCMIGVSGGVDSTYLAYIAKQVGLRALLVHCDNGWNSELAVKNIQNICDYTGFDLYTLVLDWEEFKDIQLSFFKANVVDVELPYDYALIISIYKAALKFKVNYVLTGHNVVTEGTYLPKSWRHEKMDIVNIKDIHKKFGKLKMRSFPHFSFFRQRLIDKKLHYVSLLNFVGYNKEEVKNLITTKMNWRDYGGKHYENVFTRFYQGYILNKKFKIDKRQFHLSVLVQSGQITREQALAEYALPAYNAEQLEIDKQFVLKKLGFSESEFNNYISAPAKSHYDYKSVNAYWQIYFKLVKKFKFLKFW
jgi:N-acetyl sugar amidotransferase